MRPIGGEIEVAEIKEYIYFTDSGRSSLRLLLRSKKYQKKIYLLPDFFCEVIEKIFQEEGILYQFYHINSDLSIDIESIRTKTFDALYVIHYFGQITDITSINMEDKLLIEDNVFFFDFANYTNAKEWFGFNSFRKISSLADGSMIKTNLDIDGSLIVHDAAPFSKKKFLAKEQKYIYIHQHILNEQEYVRLFQEAEYMLDMQYKIYSMSERSQYLLLKYQIDEKIREYRYRLLKEVFTDYMLLSNVKSYSFFVLRLKTKRNVVRDMLKQKNIFLAVHWPKSSQKNILYEEVLSVPLFENYSMEEFEYMKQVLEEIICEI